jgi:3-carboxy-cis,cis-muconate cycloisomerase
VYERLGDDVVGSSTMPHKINSKITVQAIAYAARLRSQVPLALEAMQPTHEGDVASNTMMYGLMDTICPMAYELVDAMDEMFDSIVLLPERMRRNLKLWSPFIAAENAMMLLAPAMGRNHAHDLLHHAIAEASAGQGDLTQILLRNAEVRAVVPREALDDALDPERYTGRSAQMAREMAVTARAAARELQQRAGSRQ